jgi:heme oxygenase
MSSLPEVLRAATRDLHRRAERAGVMGELLRGRLPRRLYVALLRNLHALYGALEARDLPVSSLARTRALAADLDVLHGTGWAQAHPLAPSMRQYVRRLDIATPVALAAHIYVRYLGDLHGGQVLAAVVRRAYGLPCGAGTSFYDFGTEQDVAELRARVRLSLAALRLDARQCDEAAAEACWAFEQHVLLFEELGAH